jgi:hypothetical protein
MDNAAVAAPSADLARGMRCTGCRQLLPLCPPLAGEQATHWICAQCGTAYEATLRTNASIRQRKRVLLVGLNLQGSDNSRALDGLGAFLRRELSPSMLNHERRRQQRFALVSPAVVRPLNTGFSEVGAPFWAYVRDISTHGVGLVATRSITDDMLAFQVFGMQLVMQVRRCRTMKRFYEIGGPLIVRGAPGGTIPHSLEDADWGDQEFDPRTLMT